MLSSSAGTRRWGMKSLFSGVKDEAEKEEPEEREIREWFEMLQMIRHLKGVTCVSIVTFLTYNLLLVVSRFSVLHPFHSIFEIFHLSVLIHSLHFTFIYASLAYAFCRFLISFDRSKRLPRTQYSSWILFICLLLVYCYLEYFVTGNYNEALEWSENFLISLSILHIAYFNTFICSYDLCFPIAMLNRWQQINSALISTVNNVFIETLPVVLKKIFSFYFIFGFPFFGFSTFSTVFRVDLFLKVLETIVLQLFLHNIAVKILKTFMADRYIFSLPPSYVVFQPKPEQKRTLINAINSKSHTLKAFGFFDLVCLARSDPIRRKEIFSVSKPGLHPRNWSGIMNACVQNINSLRKHVDIYNQQATEKRMHGLEKHGKPFVQYRDGRSKLLHPYLSQRIILPKNQVTICKFAPEFVRNIILKLTTTELVIPKHVIYFAGVSIEALYSLLWHSIQEDCYGIVQKDLSCTIKPMLQLYLSLTNGIMLTDTNPGEIFSQSLFGVGFALQSALFSIASKFGDSLKICGLDADELQVLYYFSP